MFLDPTIKSEARVIAQELLESGEETKVFSPKPLTASEGAASYVVQRSLDGITPMAEFDVEGTKFYVGIAS